MTSIEEQVDKILNHESLCSTVFYEESQGERGSMECDCAISKIKLLFQVQRTQLIQAVQKMIKRIPKKDPDDQYYWGEKTGLERALKLIEGKE